MRMVFSVTRINKKKSTDRPGAKQLGFLLFIAGLIVLVSGFGFEQESRVKAAFVYRFCDYVSWPETAFEAPDSPIVIGVAGDTAQVNEVRAAVANKQINQRAFQVREVLAENEMQGLHIFYLTRNAKEEVDYYMQAEDLRPILLITDAEKSSPLSIINFLLIDNRIRFEISQVRAEEVSLKLSSELLSIAHRVKGKQIP